MGIFDKIKNNITHGGVDVKLQAPASASLDDASIPVEVSVVAKSSSQSIKGVRVELLRESENQSFSNSDSPRSQVSSEVVARVEDATSFVLNVGETKVVSLAIIMNTGAALSEQLPNNSALNQVADIMQKLQSVSNALNQNSYRYYIVASADVEGVAFDPSDRQSIQLLKPGQLGTAFNIGG